MKGFEFAKQFDTIEEKMIGLRKHTDGFLNTMVHLLSRTGCPCPNRRKENDFANHNRQQGKEV